MIVDQCIEEYGNGLNYHRKKNLYRILYLYFMFFPVDCTDFVSIKNK